MSGVTGFSQLATGPLLAFECDALGNPTLLVHPNSEVWV
jgi:hypothetical protein